MSAARRLPLSALALLAALPAVAPAVEKPLGANEGFVIIPLFTDKRIPRFEFEARDKGEFKVRSVEPGRQLLIVRARPGVYDLRRLSLGEGYYIEIASSEDAPATVEIVAGKIAYSGDLEMDRQGIRTGFRFGGCNIDVLRTLVALEPGADPSIFDKYPVANLAKGCESIVGAGPKSRPIAEWEAAAGRPAPEAELASLNALLARHGKGPLKLGQPAAEAWKLLEDLPKEMIARARDHETATTVMWVNLNGLWGWRGLRTHYVLPLHEGKIAAAYLRQVTPRGNTAFPEPDLRRDVQEFADGR